MLRFSCSKNKGDCPRENYSVESYYYSQKDRIARSIWTYRKYK